MFPVLKKFEASLRMGIYEDRQIHTKTGFRPIKLQEASPALILIERHLINCLTNKQYGFRTRILAQ